MRITEQDTQWERTNRLREAVDTAADHVQKVYLTFLSVGLYIAVIIGSTRDVQLLKLSLVTLPILNVGLPIVGFYIIVPWLYVLLHFNLLLQLYLLSRKLHLLNAAISRLADQEYQEEQRTRLFSFPLSQMLVCRYGRFMRSLLALVVWVTVILLPLVLLIWAQARFLPYHDEMLTWLQRAAVGLDLALLWLFWPMIVTPDGRARRWWLELITRPSLLMKDLLAKVRIIRISFDGQTKHQPEATTSKEREQPVHGLLALTLTSLIVLVFSFFVAVLPGERMEDFVLRVVPASWCSEAPSRRAISDNVSLALTVWLFEKDGAPFHRCLELSGKILVAGEPSAEVMETLRSKDPKTVENALKSVIGLDLQGRDLCCANLSKAVLPKAVLRDAKLNGVDFSLAQLQGADLYRTHLQGAILHQALLQAANLGAARLQGAILTRAQLQSANLNAAQLQGAQLTEAQLQGADLNRTHLQGAVLRQARLQGADLRSAELQFADLWRAQLQGANLSGTKL